MAKERYISVILPLRLEWEPCYSLPQGIGDIVAGDRVKVRFANKEYCGVVSSTDIIPETDREKIRPIISIEDGIGRIRQEEIALWRAVAEYYMCSIGEVYKAAYPNAKVNLEEARATAREKAAARRQKLADSVRTRIVKLEARVERRKKQLEKARKESTVTDSAYALERAKKELEMAKEALKSILKANEEEETAAGTRFKEIYSQTLAAIDDVLYAHAILAQLTHTGCGDIIFRQARYELNVHTIVCQRYGHIGLATAKGGRQG